MFKKTKSAKTSDHDDYEDVIITRHKMYLYLIFEFHIWISSGPKKKHNLKVPVCEKAESKKSLWKLLPHSDSTMAGKNYYLIQTGWEIWAS